MLRKGLLVLSRNQQVKGAVARIPLTRSLVARYVAGERAADAVAEARVLAEDGLATSIVRLARNPRDEDDAEATTAGYLELLETLHGEGLARHAEISLKLTSFGQDLPGTGAKVSTENAFRIARAARSAGTAITLDMEDHAHVEDTLMTLRELRKEYPETGIAVQANLRRTEEDCRALAYEGSRVRLCKGAYAVPGTHAFTDRHEVDRSYVRCLKVLMAGQGYPMVATHDPRLVKIAGALGTRFDRARGSYEYQLLHGVRTEEARRLAAAGEQVRIYVPYGEQWYGYLVRSLAERPANLTFFVRSLFSQK